MEKKITKYRDDFGNAAIIEEMKILPYKGAKKREKAFRLSCMAEYDSILYFVTIYETKKEALARLSEFSCGTFKEV